MSESVTRLARLMSTFRDRHPDEHPQFYRGMKVAADMMCQWLRAEKPIELTEGQIHLSDEEIMGAIGDDE